jgi:predicted metal-dependent hydrolase
MALVTANYLPYSLVQLLALASVDRILLDPIAAAAAFRYFWIRPGLMPRGVVTYLRYYMPSFHPWEHDNTELLRRWQKTSAAQA